MSLGYCVLGRLTLATAGYLLRPAPNPMWARQPPYRSVRVDAQPRARIYVTNQREGKISSIRQAFISPRAIRCLTTGRMSGSSWAKNALLGFSNCNIPTMPFNNSAYLSRGSDFLRFGPDSASTFSRWHSSTISARPRSRLITSRMNSSMSWLGDITTVARFRFVLFFTTAERGTETTARNSLSVRSAWFVTSQRQ